MSKIDFRIVIDSDVKDRFKEACKNLETPPSMSSEIEKFMNWFAACVEDTEQKPKLSDISQGYHSDMSDIAVEGTNNTTNEKIFSILEELKSNFEDLKDRLEEVDKNSDGPKINVEYRSMSLQSGHKLIANHLTKRLSEHKQSQGKRAMGRGTLRNHRNQHKDNPEEHRKWIKDRDPQGLFWDYNEEESVYIASLE